MHADRMVSFKTIFKTWPFSFIFLHLKDLFRIEGAMFGQNTLCNYLWSLKLSPQKWRLLSKFQISFKWAALNQEKNSFFTPFQDRLCESQMATGWRDLGRRWMIHSKISDNHTDQYHNHNHTDQCHNDNHTDQHHNDNDDFIWWRHVIMTFLFKRRAQTQIDTNFRWVRGFSLAFCILLYHGQVMMMTIRMIWWSVCLYVCHKSDYYSRDFVISPVFDTFKIWWPHPCHIQSILSFLLFPDTFRIQKCLETGKRQNPLNR